MTGIAYIALARAPARQGGLAEAEQLLDQALPLLDNDSYQVQYAQALLEPWPRSATPAATATAPAPRPRRRAS